MLIGIDPGPESGKVGLFYWYNNGDCLAEEYDGRADCVMFLLREFVLDKQDTIIIESVQPYGKRPLSKVIIETIELVGMVKEFCREREIPYHIASWPVHAQYLCVKQGMVKDRDVRLVFESIYGKDKLKEWGVTNSHTRTALSLVHWYRGAKM